jgi:hypothetical protein
VDVVVKLVLPGRGAAVHHDVHGVAARDAPHHGRQALRDVEEVVAERRRQVDERLVVLARHDEQVPGVHRLARMMSQKLQ